MKAFLSFFIVCSAFGIVSILDGATARAENLTEEKFHELLKELRSTDDELWRSIAWRIDLLEAQRDAVNERKPIFIWAMDGHPLGCT